MAPIISSWPEAEVPSDVFKIIIKNPDNKVHLV